MISASTPDGPLDGAPAGLRGKVVRGGAWLAGHYILRQTLRFFRIVIVARIVTPADIGLIGMAALAITLVRVFTETGLQQAVIQRRDESRDLLDTAWAVLLIRNLAIAILLAAGAGLVARFFNEPAAEAVVRVVSLVLVLEGITNIAVVLFQKRLDFRRQTFYLGGSEIVEFVATVLLAITLRNVWALVYGWIVGAAVRVTLSYVAEPRRPRFYLNRQIVASLIKYGKWLTASSILTYVLLNGDKLVVGRFMGTDALGFYQIAFTISSLPATAITQVISGVMFPTFASLQDNLPRLARLYMRSVRISALLSVPIAVLIAALADVLVLALLDTKWLPSVPLIQVLALFGLTRSLGATTGSVFLAIGRPDIRTRIQIAQVVVFVIAIYPMVSRWGMTGVAAAVSTYAVVTNLYAIHRAAAVCKLPARGVVEALLVPFASGVLAYAVLVAVRSFALDGDSIGVLFLLASIGAIVYIGVVAGYDALRGHTWRKDLTDVLKAVRHDERD